MYNRHIRKGNFWLNLSTPPAMCFPTASIFCFFLLGQIFKKKKLLVLLYCAHSYSEHLVETSSSMNATGIIGSQG